MVMVRAIASDSPTSSCTNTQEPNLDRVRNSRAARFARFARSANSASKARSAYPKDLTDDSPCSDGEIHISLTRNHRCKGGSDNNPQPVG